MNLKTITAQLKALQTGIWKEYGVISVEICADGSGRFAGTTKTICFFGNLKELQDTLERKLILNQKFLNKSLTNGK